MNSETNETIVRVCFLGALLSCVVMAIMIGYEEGYKAGQLDAALGEMKYELKEQKNGEKIWERKDE